MEKTQEELKLAQQEATAKAHADKSLEDELGLDQKDEETVESLRARAEKAEQERENYKKAFLKAKGKSDNEEHEEEEEQEESTDVEKVATNAATQVIEKANEKQAIAQFTDRYPALKDPTAWAKVVENYVPRAGKMSVESIRQDLEAALILAKHYGGGKVAEKEVSLNKYAAVSHAGSYVSHESQQELSNSSIELGRSFGHSVDELKAASEDGAHEIRLI